ncbi:MAG: ASPIC/UnbV domain-containing protein, partial [Planctomycetota bacterium]
HFRLVEPSTSGGYLGRQHVARALWTVDADRDGRVDVMVTHQGEPLALLANETESENAWLRVRLVGRSVARDPVGATVSIRWDRATRMAPLVSGDGFYCRNESVLHFGLGPVSEEQEIAVSVDWPNGQTQTVRAKPNEELLVVQNELEPFVLNRSE